MDVTLFSPSCSVNTFATNNLTVGRNGSKIGGASAADLTVNTNGAALTFIYVDGTQGWLVINES